MMRSLWLLRHAKASAGRDDETDHERPLERRGRKAASGLGQHLAERGVGIDLVLCSTALRARQTFERVGEALAAPPDVEFDEDLYLASAEELLSVVGEAPDAAQSVMVVGHNPGIGELAARLALRGDPELRADLQRGFPTCALAELRHPADAWDAFRGACELVSYFTPKARA